MQGASRLVCGALFASSGVPRLAVWSGRAVAEEAEDDRFADDQACAQVLVIGPGGPLVAGDLRRGCGEILEWTSGGCNDAADALAPSAVGERISGPLFLKQPKTAQRMQGSSSFPMHDCAARARGHQRRVGLLHVDQMSF